jgi:thiol-disulfide isomerase/thioredoxin
MYRALITFLTLFFCISLSAQGIAPNFVLSELSSEKLHQLEDYRGRVVYLDFWASWCGPCRQSLPALDKLQQEYSPNDFVVLAINLDERSEDALAFLEQYPVSYTVLTEKTGKTQRAYELVGLPSSVLIDQKGEIIGMFQGFHPDHVRRIKKALTYLLE